MCESCPTTEAAEALYCMYIAYWWRLSLMPANKRGGVPTLLRISMLHLPSVSLRRSPNPRTPSNLPKSHHKQNHASSLALPCNHHHPSPKTNHPCAKLPSHPHHQLAATLLLTTSLQPPYSTTVCTKLHTRQPSPHAAPTPPRRKIARRIRGFGVFPHAGRDVFRSVSSVHHSKPTCRGMTKVSNLRREIR